MAVSLAYKFFSTITETLETGVDGAQSPDITHDGFNVYATINATSGVPATKAVVGIQTLSGGALTIDLTSLTGTNGASVDLTGLKPQYIFLANGTAISGGVITYGTQAVQDFTVGAANGYPIWGATNTVDLLGGQCISMFFNDSQPDVSASVKTIDVTGTGTEKFIMALVAG